MGLYEYKNVHRPARVVSFDQEKGILLLVNKLNFTGLKDYVKLFYEVTCDGHITESGWIREEDIAEIHPHEEGILPLAIAIPRKGRVFLKIKYFLKKADGLREEGHFLGFDEIPLKNEDGANQTVKEWLEKWDARSYEVSDDFKDLIPSQIQVKENARQLIITGKEFVYEYSKLTGIFTRLSCHGVEVVERPLEYNIWRAPTDNDIQIKKEWYRAKYDCARSRAYETSYTYTDKCLEVKSHISLSAPGLQKMMMIDACWLINGKGEIHMVLHVKRDVEFPELPRFGLRLFLPERMNQVTYYGMGPGESYVDKHQASWHGLFESHVENMHEDYIRPQENGSHADCDFVIVNDAHGKLKLTACSKTSFSFNASNYSQEELTKKAHNYELEPDGHTILNLDYKQNGIGSASCGPRLSGQYRFDEESFTYDLFLIPEIQDQI